MDFHKLAVCAIFKNEAPYLKEWIEFHKLQGAEHFFLYNNNSNDHYLTVLQPYIDSGQVTLTDWPFTYQEGEYRNWLSIQNHAYMDCIEKYKQNIQWLAFIDIDEFFFCPSGESLPSFLENYKQYGAVCAHWLLFGTSYLEDLPPGKLMIESLLCCSLPDNGRNSHVKSIVQPKHVKSSTSEHFFIFEDGYIGVDAEGHKITNETSPYISHKKIRVNHYFTRTEKYFWETKIPSRSGRYSEQTEQFLLLQEKEYNLSKDTEILQFVPALRKIMGYDN